MSRRSFRPWDRQEGGHDSFGQCDGIGKVIFRAGCCCMVDRASFSGDISGNLCTISILKYSLPYCQHQVKQSIIE
jgi:hypothetical protein